jgi:putative ABC transport system permease protein
VIWVNISRSLAPLDRKLFRDLWRMKGQAVAIALVIALGVMLLVMMDGLINSLEETKRAYYERYRFADVFAPTSRAPESLLKDLALIPGVALVEGRIKGGALINLPGISTPLAAQAISLPDDGSPRLNALYLSEGRLINPAKEDEILLLKAFAKAHQLSPGDTLSATMNGARRTFFIAGLAQSPEFLYSAPPGEMMPDDARFAVIWMSQRAMSAAYDLKGAFNEALFSLTRDARLPAVLNTIDNLLENYGGTGSYGAVDHVSDRFIQEEINGLSVSSKSIPPVFLAVAAFLLYIVISRMVEAEREQIGLLKAFGYSNREVGLHYVKFTLIIAAAGSVIGCLLGIYAGRSLVGIYLVYYKFPFLIFQVDPRSFITGVTVSLLAASSGGALVLRKVFLLTPAVAMRPSAPLDYSQSANIGQWMKSFLDQPSRMVIRRLYRQPGRSILAIIGIATGMALSVAMLGIMSGFDTTVDLNFNVINRSDISVNFIEPVSDKAIYELGRMDNVINVEPFRNVSAILRNGQYRYRGAINGLISKPQLSRAVNNNMRPIFIRKNGIILAKPLAEILHIHAGETLTIEVSEGRRPILEVPVIGIAETLLGAPAFMEIETLNRAMKEPNRVSGAHLRIDTENSDVLYRILKDMPSIAGVSLKNEARMAFQNVLDTGAGAIRFIMAAVAGLITFGIIYNSARIAFAERVHDLASLRVIGFTRSETAFVLLGELAVITLLALPVGAGLGYFLGLAIADGFSTDLYQIPAMVTSESYGIAAIAVLIASAISGWFVKRDINKIDMVSALKTRE